MKTLQELKKEIAASVELQKTCLEALQSGKTVEFLKAQGCSATEEEMRAFLKSEQSGELADEELDNVAGGACSETISCIYCGQPVKKYFARDGMHPECLNKVQFSTPH